MRLRTFMLAGAAALLVSPAFAGDGWYIGLGAGWDHLRDPKVVGDGLDGKLNTKDSAIVAGAVGYKFASPFRIEFEGAWARHSTGDFTTGGFTLPSSGHAEVRSAMINGLYDVRLMPRVRLSIGAGAGIGSDRIKFENPFGPGHFSTSSGTKFMWQGIGGLTYEASRNLDLYVDYHYRSLMANSNNNIAAPLKNHDLTEHVVMAGFRWYPDAGQERVAYQEPPAPPPPPPPPPPPAPVKTFIVFFDFNKSNLTPEAVSVVGEAVKAAQQSQAVRILVTGHTDTVGSDSYNQALSERRATAVKSQMVADGLRAEEITTTGKSFHDPLVPTGPNVREPQNRRAVIDLGG
ncbi:MAG TPA: OmpA family protein [Rhizomicrobium sp.]|nr:OmpA family protein [Rhizomicrobium sp.]